MIKITEEFINSVAPNNSAVQNGLGLVKKNSFVKLFKSQDETIIFGECSGSGKNNYITSADFIAPEAPVFRCTCPSRQIPCKHALGLMYAYIKDKDFEVAEIPEDVLSKREKIEKKEVKKKEVTESGKPATPKKVNKSALSKKIKSQIEGLELAEKISKDILRSGLGAMDAKAIQMLEEQAKQLGNYFLPGVQVLLRRIISYLSSKQKEEIYTTAFNEIIALASLAKKGKDYLTKRLEDPELTIDSKTNLEETLGHAWLLEELRTANLIEENVELVQLFFTSLTSEERKEYVDYGLWLNLHTGKLNAALGYRPFKAAKYMKEEDSFFSVLQAKELYTYPGEDMSPRVRWEDFTIRDITKEDYKAIKNFARKSYADVIKEVKNQLKNTLSDKHPEVLLAYSKLGKIENNFVIEDASGKRLLLEDNFTDTGKAACDLLPLLNPEVFSNQAILVRFDCDLDNGKLFAEPLSIVTDSEIIRLVY